MTRTHKRTARAIGATVAKHRARLNLSRPQLAHKLAVDRTHVWRIERGLTRPSPDLEDKMVALFGITIDELRGKAASAA